MIKSTSLPIMIKAFQISDDVFSIVESIKEDIFLGILKPRERLVELSLSEKFNVNRSKLRKALMELAEMDGAWKLMILAGRSRISSLFTSASEWCVAERPRPRCAGYGSESDRRDPGTSGAAARPPHPEADNGLASTPTPVVQPSTRNPVT